MLTLGNPAGLALLGAAIPVIVLYFLRTRFRRRPAGSNFIWSRIADRASGGRKPRRRSLALLAMQLGVIIAAALVLASPAIISTRLLVPGVAFLVDVSASMSTLDGGSTGKESRIREAADIVERELANLPPGTPRAIFACSSSLIAVSPPGTDVIIARARLQSLKAGDEGFDEARVAADLKAWLAEREEAWSFVLVSDGGLEQGGLGINAAVSAPGSASRLRTFIIGKGGGAEGISGFRLVQNGDAAQVLAQFSLWNGAKFPRSFHLILSRNGVKISSETILAASGWSRAEMQADRMPEGEYSITIDEPSGRGPGSTCRLAINSVEPPAILMVGKGDPFLRAVFSGLGNVFYAEKFSEDILKQRYDLVIADRVEAPADLDAAILSFGIPPSASPIEPDSMISGSVQSSPTADALTRFIDWDGAQALDARSFKAAPGLRVISTIQGKHVIGAWESDGRKRVFCGVDLARSDIALKAAFPVFIRNIVSWCLPPVTGQSAFTLTAGEKAVRAEPESFTLSSDADITISRTGPLIDLTARKAGFFSFKRDSVQGSIAVNPPASELDAFPRTLLVPGELSSEVSQSGSVPMRVLSRVELGLIPLIALVLLLAVEWYIWHNSPYAKPLFFRLAALLFCLTAFVSLRLPFPTRTKSVTFLIDVSASMESSLIEEAREAALRMIHELKNQDSAGIITFAGKPRIIARNVSPEEAERLLESAVLDAPEREDTDLGAALQAAWSLAQKSRGKALVVLFSDGRSNQGKVPEAVPGQNLLIVPVASRPTTVGDQGLVAPAYARPGEKILLRWRIASNDERPLEYTVSVDGNRVQAGSVRLKPGINDVSIEVEAGAPGTQAIVVEALEQDGKQIAGVSSGVFVGIVGQERVLVVRGDGKISPIAASLRAQGIPVKEGSAENIPRDSAGFSGLSAIVLDDIHALSFSEDQQEALINYVSSGGGALFVGGTASLGRGEYYATRLEELLPVMTDARRRFFFTKAKLLFIIDRSTSMSEKSGAASKQLLAMQGVAAALTQLNAQDEVGILAFDSDASWILPFTPVRSSQTALAELSNLGEGGGTNMATAFEEALKAFGEPGPTKRHAIILSDGLTADADFAALSGRLKEARVSVSTIGIGAMINEKLLKSIAELNGGVFYRAEPGAVPLIIDKETIRLTRELMQEGKFSFTVRDSSSMTEGLAAGSAIRGYLITTAKEKASVLAEAVDAAGKKDPLLVSWRYGNGEVAVFTSDSGMRWMAPWSGTAMFNRLWGQIIRSIERLGPDSGLRASAQLSGSDALIVVTALDSERRSRSALHLIGRISGEAGSPFSFIETAPGRYEGHVPLSGKGLRHFEIAEAATGAWTSAWVWNPPGPEHANLGPDLATLGALATASGGTIQSWSTIKLPDRTWAWVAMDSRYLVIILAIFIFLIELVIRSAVLGQFSAALKALQSWWLSRKAEAALIRRPWQKADEDETA